ncbi:MAG: MFS transporter [Bacteroidales bacterium]|nr:MFS transporter [Bacteroidales bacterium]
MGKQIKYRLVLMYWLQFAIWGSYLTSMGGYLGSIGLGQNIGWFYSVQGIVSIFTPALFGIIADRWVPAQKLLGFSHLIAASLMLYVGYTGITHGDAVQFADIFPPYVASVAFYMPTLALANSLSYTVLSNNGLDTVKEFPSIRIFGTIGFIVAMWIVDLVGIQHNAYQFIACAAWGFCLGIYSFTMPNCPVSAGDKKASAAESFGLKAFALFKSRKMLIFFIFSMLLGISLQITNGFANPFIAEFKNDSAYADVYFANHPNILISISQMSETLCILLIPFFLKRFGIKQIMLIAMLAWALRFGLFSIGDPSWPGVLLLITSMLVYGVAFDFFLISGSLFVDKETEPSIRSSAQGLFMLMTNGLGAAIGTMAAQTIVNHFVIDGAPTADRLCGWSASWEIFACYSVVVAVLFALIFRYKKNNTDIAKG